MKRAIRIEGMDVELELSRATGVKTRKRMIHLDEMKDGTWRLIYNEDMIPDFTKVESLKVIRED